MYYQFSVQSFIFFCFAIYVHLQGRSPPVFYFHYNERRVHASMSLNGACFQDIKFMKEPDQIDHATTLMQSLNPAS
jgi:hypothetical protein